MLRLVVLAMLVCAAMAAPSLKEVATQKVVFEPLMRIAKSHIPEEHHSEVHRILSRTSASSSVANPVILANDPCQGPLQDWAISLFQSGCVDFFSSPAFTEVLENQTSNNAVYAQVCENKCYAKYVSGINKYFDCIENHPSYQNISAFISIFRRSISYVCSKEPRSGTYCGSLTHEPLIDGVNSVFTPNSTVCDIYEDWGCCVRSLANLQNDILNIFQIPTTSALYQSYIQCPTLNGTPPCVTPGEPRKIGKAKWRLTGLAYAIFQAASAAQQEEYYKDLEVDIANNLDRPVGQVRVTGVSPGSWVVDFRCQGETDPETLECVDKIETVITAGSATLPQIESATAANVSVDPTTSGVNLVTEGALSGDSSKDDGLSGGAIAGIVFVVILLIAGAIFAGVMYHGKQNPHSKSGAYYKAVNNFCCKESRADRRMSQMQGEGMGSSQYAVRQPQPPSTAAPSAPAYGNARVAPAYGNTTN